MSEQQGNSESDIFGDMTDSDSDYIPGSDLDPSTCVFNVSQWILMDIQN